MLSFEAFKAEVLDFAKRSPKNWRLGQSVFNYIDDAYGVARAVQFKEHVDCFYRDDKIDEFIEKSYNILKSIENDRANN